MLKNGDKVVWQEGGAGQYTCTGTIVCEDKDHRGQNQHGFFTIRVDMDDIANYHRACHTASEMNLQCVSRSTDFNKLRKDNHGNENN